MTHAERIAAIRAREAATGFQGPMWASTEADGHSLNNDNILWRDEKGDVWALLRANHHIGDTSALRDFIAHARADIPYLLARVEALEAALGEAIEKMRPLADLFEMAQENNESIECTFLERWAYPYDDSKAAFKAIDRLTAIKEGTTDAK